MGNLMNQVFYTDAYDLSIVSLIVAVFAVAIVAWVVWELAQVILRHMIGNEYSVRVPFSVRVGRNRRHSPDGFSMGYPYWQAAKKDGTRDLRTNNKRIVRIPTVIFLGRWRLSVKNPFVAYDLVNGLRDAGHDMGRCPRRNGSSGVSRNGSGHAAKRPASTASWTDSKGIRPTSSPSAPTCSARSDGRPRRRLPPETEASISG